MEGGPSRQNRENQINPTDSNQTEPKNCAYKCCHPSGTFHRFVVLFFICWLGFGTYFCYDSPAALLNVFKRDLQITSTEFSLFYSLYSWPSVISATLGGILIDSLFGIRLGANIYMAIALIGHIFFATGAMFNVFWIMVLGRFIFGLGSEPLAVAVNNYAVLWFKGKELNMVFGMQISFSKLGSAANFWLVEPIYQWVDQFYKGYECLGIVLYIASLACVISMASSLILDCMDKRAERILRRNDNATKKVIGFKDVRGFKKGYWLITITCFHYYVAIFVFIAFAKEFFMDKFKLPAASANQMNSVVYLMSLIGSPVLGLIVDKFGRNLFWVNLSISSTLCAHIILAFAPWNPYVGMVLMGFGDSLLSSSLWPLVCLLIPAHQLGTAYGIMQSIQNLGLAIGSIIAGLIVDHHGYIWLEVFFIGNLIAALVTGVIMLFIDSSNNGFLNMTPAQRERQQQAPLVAEVVEREKAKPAGVTT